MAQTERYWGQFQDVNNDLWTIRIYKEGYTGESSELTLGDNPLVINYEDDGDVFKPVVYSQCTIKVLTDKILDIYSKNIRFRAIRDKLLATVEFNFAILHTFKIMNYCFLNSNKRQFNVFCKKMIDRNDISFFHGIHPLVGFQ